MDEDLHKRLANEERHYNPCTHLTRATFFYYRNPANLTQVGSSEQALLIRASTHL